MLLQKLRNPTKHITFNLDIIWTTSFKSTASSIMNLCKRHKWNSNMTLLFYYPTPLFVQGPMLFFPLSPPFFFGTGRTLSDLKDSYLLVPQTELQCTVKSCWCRFVGGLDIKKAESYYLCRMFHTQDELKCINV